jgi:hypothetical protein
VKLCVDCKYFVEPQRRSPALAEGLEPICAHPNNHHIDPVFGGSKAWSPSWLRAEQFKDKCGPDGNWWEESQ